MDTCDDKTFVEYYDSPLLHPGLPTDFAVFDIGLRQLQMPAISYPTSLSAIDSTQPSEAKQHALPHITPKLKPLSSSPNRAQHASRSAHFPESTSLRSAPRISAITTSPFQQPQRTDRYVTGHAGPQTRLPNKVGPSSMP